ncbi:MAG: hypothetical protein ACM3PF_08890 [Bacteroidota bacterium]
MDRRRLHPQGVLAVLVIVAAGCGLFEPREPKLASVIPPPPCLARLDPDSVVVNIAVHYARGGDCYPAQLADSVSPELAGFHFYPDIQDSLESLPRDPFTGWNKAIETSVTLSVAASADTIIVVFDSTYASPTIGSTSPTRETFYYEYHLLAVTAPGDTTRYQGQAELTMVRPTTTWSLEGFRDHRDASGRPTWGILRGSKRQASP